MSHETELRTILKLRRLLRTTFKTYMEYPVSPFPILELIDSMRHHTQRARKVIDQIRLLRTRKFLNR